MPQLNSWKTLTKWSFRFFGGSLEPFVKYFDSIKSDLLRSNIGLGLSEYFYVAMFVTLFAFVIEFPTVVIIMAILLQDTIIAFMFSLSLMFILVGMFATPFSTAVAASAVEIDAKVDATLSKFYEKVSAASNSRYPGYKLIWHHIWAND